MKRIIAALLTAAVGLALFGAAVRAGDKCEKKCEPKPCLKCICEPKERTKFVYRCTTEDYCLAHCKLKAMFTGKCGCDGESCAKPRCRHLLVIKKVKCPDGHKHTPVCDDSCPPPLCTSAGDGAPVVIGGPPV